MIRKLAAILAADVVGYTALMEADEVGTLAALRAHRTDIFDPTVALYHGRIVKLTGDGALVEFPSVVDAVEAAVEIQKALASSAASIRLRIGINLGDVIVEDNDLYGDGVNLAARLEAVSDPGGIAISATVRENVWRKVSAHFENRGHQNLKNISEPVEVWAWVPESSETVSETPNTAHSIAPGNSAKLDEGTPSVAVLPFDNMSGDPEQEFFADGMTEDIITDLSKISGLLVVARNSSFVFKGKAVDIREVAEKLGVRYVLEGSVRKAGARVRINAQLIDSLTGGHLWADRYDGSIEDVFELQDEVGAQVVSALKIHLTRDEEARLRHVHTHNVEAYEIYVRARAMPYPPIPERISAAREMFEQVIELAPDFAGGHAGLAWILCAGPLFGARNVTEEQTRAESLARHGIALDESFGWSYVALGLALLLQADHAAAIKAIDDAVARQPNDADAHAYRAIAIALNGQPEQALEPIELALRLNPQFVSGPYLNIKSLIQLLAGDYFGAIQTFEANVARQGPVGPPALAWSAVAYRELGNDELSKAQVARIKTQFPRFRIRNWRMMYLMRPDERRAWFSRSIEAVGLMA